MVEAPADGFVVRDPLIDAMMGRAEGGEGGQGSGDANQGGFDDDVILGGNPTFTSRSSGQFAPQSAAPPARPNSAMGPRPPQQPPGDLPLFPDLNKMSSNAGPRRISVGESAVFERRVGKGAPTRGRANAQPASQNGYGPQSGASGGSFGNSNGSFGSFNSPGGVSIKGDSSIFSSTGFVGGGGSTNVFSSGSGASGGSTTGGFNSGIASGGPGSRSRATSSNFNTGNTISNRNDGGNVGNSFRDGTGREYNSSFGNVARNAGQSRGGVNIKGDSSIFSSSGFVGGGNSGYDTSGTRAGGRGQSGVRPPPPPVRSAPTYNTQHVFDAPPKSPAATSVANDNAYSVPNNQFNGADDNAYTTPTPPNFNTGQAVSSEFNNNPYSVPTPPQPNNYNSGSSLADNFLTTKASVRRSGPVPGGDDDYDPDDEMLGYESPTRRGDGFLTEPEPQFVNIPIHTGKWMSELYAEQGLDVFSGGAAGYGVVKGEVEKGGGRGGGDGGTNPGYGSNGANNGYQDSPGYGNDAGYANNGYDNGYGNNNPGYPSNNGYGNNGYGGYQSGGSFDRFGQTPAGGY